MCSRLPCNWDLINQSNYEESRVLRSLGFSYYSHNRAKNERKGKVAKVKNDRKTEVPKIDSRIHFYTAIKEGSKSETLNRKHNENPRSLTPNEVAINTQSKIVSSIVKRHGNEYKLVNINFMNEKTYGDGPTHPADVTWPTLE